MEQWHWPQPAAPDEATRLAAHARHPHRDGLDGRLDGIGLGVGHWRDQAAGMKPTAS